MMIRVMRQQIAIWIVFLSASSRSLSVLELDRACNPLSKGETNNKKICKYKTLLAKKKQAHICSKITCLQKAKKNEFIKLAIDKPGAKWQKQNDKLFIQKAKSVKCLDIYDEKTQQELNLYKQQCDKVFTQQGTVYPTNKDKYLYIVGSLNKKPKADWKAFKDAKNVDLKQVWS